MWLLYLFLFLFFFVSAAFFAGLETGLVSLDRLKLETESKTDNRKKYLDKMTRNPDLIFGLTLIGTNISQVIVSTIFTAFFIKRWFHVEQEVGSLILAGLVLIFAEIIPKALYRDYSEKLVIRSYPFIRISSFILKPSIQVVTWFNNMIARLLKVESGMHFLSREDLSYIFSESTSTNSIQQDQKEMLEDALEFRELKAKNVMIPRTDIIAIDAESTLDHVIDLARKEGYTRYPVYKESLDHIVGILIIYDLIGRDRSRTQKAKDFIREAFFIPETMDVDILLKEMQTLRKTMAIVVDSYGGTAGLLTVEDILEEIVGEIEDEYDNDVEKDVEKISDHEFIVKGFVEVDDLIDVYGIDIPDDGDYETIAGLIINKIARIPVRNQKIKIGVWTAEILQVSSRKIIKIKLSRNVLKDQRVKTDAKD